MIVTLAQEAAGTGTAAIIVALGGVITSLTTVWINNRKQVSATSENKGNIDSLTEQIGHMASQISELKAENASLKTELAILKAQEQARQNIESAPQPKKKAPKKK